ncbi:MAG: hypothetical protein JTT12_05605 [Candidatus Brockarchaeota archaeon]|nr:hypothetical protein [Candidatus Brockarchaeota archaeon]
MNLIEFQRFVVTHPDYDYGDKLLNKIADKTKELLSKNEVVSLARLSQELNVLPTRILTAINKFLPEEVAQKNIEEKKRELRGEKETKRLPTATKEIEASLGEAYSKNIKKLSEHYSWFGEAMMGIGKVAFEGYLMNLNVSPEDTEKFLTMFENPNELIEGFKTFFTALLKFSVGASEMESIISELEDYKDAVEYAKKIIRSQRELIAEQQKMIAMLSVVVPKKKLEQVMDSELISRIPMLEEAEKNE